MQKLQTLQEENQKLQLENQKLRRQLLEYRLEQGVTDDAVSRELAGNMQQFFPDPVSDYYALLLFYGGQVQYIYGQGEKPPNPVESVRSEFSEVLSPFGQTFFFASSGCTACLLNFTLDNGFDGNQLQTPEQLQRLQEALTRQVKQRTDHMATAYISVSGIMTMESGPRMLYRSAVSVSEQRTAHSPSVCIQQEEISFIQSPPEYGYQIELEFWRLVGKHAFFQAAECLDLMIDRSSSQNGFLERTSAAVFSRLEMVLYSIGQHLGNEPTIDSDIAEAMGVLSGVNNYETLRDTAHDILAMLEDKYFTQPNTRNHKMVFIESYIREHYSDPNLGAAQISEEFKISTSYLSRIFREDMNMSVVSFIHQVRIAAAKQLLANTEKTISQIAEQVGFSNHWVFIRVFKKLEGTTPGAYRDFPL